MNINGISTRKIYLLAFNLLKKESYKIAGRYRLKNAIMELGPTGFPFEIFVGRIFEAMGYEGETGVIVQGRCVQHEVDVIARKAESWAACRLFFPQATLPRGLLDEK